MPHFDGAGRRASGSAKHPGGAIPLPDKEWRGFPPREWCRFLVKRGHTVPKPDGCGGFYPAAERIRSRRALRGFPRPVPRHAVFQTVQRLPEPEETENSASSG